MTVEQVVSRRGAYHDSVALMQVSRDVAAADGVLAAQVAMATELNLGVLRSMGFTPPDGSGPNDLLIAVRAADDAGLAAGFAAVEQALAPPSGSRDADPAAGLLAAGAVTPRTVGSALRAGDATLALVSVPGQHAFTEAMDAVAAGAHVMVFSDNVPLAQEIRLKDEAAARGLLVMGPDCGTAVVAGVGLGFANVATPGPVGLVAASGTGAQQLLCLLDGAGIGVSHCLGVGGRDLSAAVAGRSTRQALAMLDADPATALIVVVSKPPDPVVEAALRAFAATLSTPVHWALIGTGRADLTVAARAAVEAVGGAWSPPRQWPAPTSGVGPEARASTTTGRAVLRGAFAGGTLCDEAMVIASAALGPGRPLASNIPLDGAPRVDPLAQLDPLADAFVDFGDDELTRGRPHPMIDNSLRAQWIASVAASAGSGPSGGAVTSDEAGPSSRFLGHGVVLLLDVVLGHGAHPDPAVEVAEALRDAGQVAAAREVPFAAVVSLCGTGSDPQGLERQAALLADAGAGVYLSNAAAARAACELAGAAWARQTAAVQRFDERGQA